MFKQSHESEDFMTLVWYEISHFIFKGHKVKKSKQ